MMEGGVNPSANSGKTNQSSLRKVAVPPQKGPIDIVRSLWSQYGIRGFYKGYLMGVLTQVLIFFVLFCFSMPS